MKNRARIICLLLAAVVTAGNAAYPAAIAKADDVVLMEGEGQTQTQESEGETEKLQETEIYQETEKSQETETPQETETSQETEKSQETEDQAQHITTVEQLQAVKGDGVYVLDSDLDLTGKTWSSISEFSGTLDGQGHTIKGLSSALIAKMTGGTIKNLNLSDVAIAASGSTGALVTVIENVQGQVEISNCSVTGTISGTNEVGGLIGRITCVSSNEAASVTLTGLANSANLSGTSKIGGIVGTISLEDEATGQDGKVSVSQCSNVGKIDCVSSYSGGIAGYIEIPKFAAAVQAVKIENSFNAGKMRDGGNIVGEAAIASGSLYISKCIGIQTYNSATKGIVDHVAAMNGGTTGYCTLSDCYYYTATGEYAFTSGSTVSGTATALNETQIKTAGSFTNFDFTNVWAVDAGKNNGYPYLKDVSVLEAAYSAPAKGTVLNDSTTEGTYKITAPGLTVTYMGTTNSAATTVTIPTTVEIDGWTYEVTAIASRAFYKNTTLTKITIPSTVKVINCGAFFGCTSLKTVSGAKSVEKIYKNAFRDCKQLKTLGGTSGRLTLPSVTFLGKRAFLNCTAATKLLISSQNLKTIAAGAFRNCASLTKVNISSTELAHIGAYAFYKDAKLTSIIFYTEELTTSNVGGKAFKGIHASAIFQIPSGKTSAYKTLFQTKGAGSTISVKAL